ncbi:MAG: COX15/CtaA family protein [Gammaproteobacteria bacterium]|nr:COX15/CtaA family protein [Gammaproteobacteria bacterium]
MPGRTRFLWMAIITVITIYCLILVGGIVRATGAGMGCPDWPTCFGQWIPPTSESQLPLNYQEIYADRGYADTEFNVRKTWTEYLNRLLGVITGFTILLTFLFSIVYRRINKPVFMLALIGFILVCVQGWLGSRVVASNLNPGMITLHMLLAQLIVAIVIASVLTAERKQLATISLSRLPKAFFWLFGFAMVLGILQLVVGTQVREAVDIIAKQSDYENRHLWLDNLPIVLEFHKYGAIPLVIINVWVAFALITHTSSKLLKLFSITLIALMLGTTVMGLSMDQLNLPMFAQPLHLWFASIIFGTQFAIWLTLRYAVQAQPAASLQPGTAVG